MLLPHVKEAEQFMQLFGREYLTFDVSLQRSQVRQFYTCRTITHTMYYDSTEDKSQKLNIFKAVFSRRCTGTVVCWIHGAVRHVVLNATPRCVASHIHPGVLTTTSLFVHANVLCGAEVVTRPLFRRVVLWMYTKLGYLSF